MSQEPSASVPDRADPSSKSPGPRHRPESVEAAKTALLEPSRKGKPPLDLLRQHPYVASAAAVAVGVVVMRTPGLRKVASAAAVWGIKQAVQRYTRRTLKGD